MRGHPNLQQPRTPREPGESVPEYMQRVSRGRQEVQPGEKIVLRISEKEYQQIEGHVLSEVRHQYPGSDAGALGVRAGAEIVMRMLRHGVLLYEG